MKSELPDYIHLQATNRQYFVLAGGSAALVVMLMVMRFSGDGVASEINIWLTVLFSMITLIGAAAALLKRPWLTLDADGFESSELKAIGKIAWKDASPFSLYRYGGRGMPATNQVAFKLTKERRKQAPRIAGMLFSGTVRLTEHYKVNGPRLVHLMNAFRERAVGPEHERPWSG